MGHSTAKLSLDDFPEPEQVVRLRAQLLEWYGRMGRDLPWRRTRDPYAIWISEIMLQQTQVKTVLPYYQRWLIALPTVTDLADADLETVLKLWEGLGYYTRARNLHKTAQAIVKEHGGVFPETARQLQVLPGIGRSTAGAIASSAFGRCEAILDANVRRVLGRLLAVDDPPARAEAKLWEISQRLVDPQAPHNFNQALMDLGATVCTARSPLCLLCPWQADCLGRRSGEPTRFPVRPARTVRSEIAGVSVLIECQGKFLLVRRPERGLLAGLWEFPFVESVGGGEPEETVRMAFGNRLESLERLGQVEHEFTHRHLTAQVLWARWAATLDELPDCIEHREHAWVAPEHWPEYAMPAYVRKICRLQCLQ
ncbi:A/G-specific adenine glycosylase [Gloeobacter morelensis]|uniref:Adenine DNA glycosylase n=1 Tax=Gloeobacter morelensis MG652769 TaxID=2781736 RepID=A0ABY3PSB5_9CYAN|nr:A/G-specific adenine glycosylase [Gloeobacter morelensis]UFP96613.1 A/G-specific adenine glycosylase [Gloeobacter morelensis MG652769]